MEVRDGEEREYEGEKRKEKGGYQRSKKVARNNAREAAHSRAITNARSADLNE